MPSPVRVLSSALLALAAAACAGNTRHVYPMLPLPGDRERAATCEQVDDDILRTDAVRWSMRSEGMTLRTSATNTGLLLAGLSLVAVGAMPMVAPDLGRQAQLGAADARLVALLEIKKSNACPERATADPSHADLDVLRQLQALAADRQARNISEHAALAERTRLLDGLCDPRAISTSGRVATPRP
jgi:hypothetical protein